VTQLVQRVLIDFHSKTGTIGHGEVEADHAGMSPPFLAISTRGLETEPRTSLFDNTDSQSYCPLVITIGNVFLYYFPLNPFAEILLFPGFDPDVVTAESCLSSHISSDFFTKSRDPDPEASCRECPSRDQA
jgi:hypothetical protein